MYERRASKLEAAGPQNWGWLVESLYALVGLAVPRRIIMRGSSPGRSGPEDWHFVGRDGESDGTASER
jgi:hypothetical protein